MSSVRTSKRVREQQPVGETSSEEFRSLKLRRKPANPGSYSICRENIINFVRSSSPTPRIPLSTPHPRKACSRPYLVTIPTIWSWSPITPNREGLPTLTCQRTTDLSHGLCYILSSMQSSTLSRMHSSLTLIRCVERNCSLPLMPIPCSSIVKRHILLPGGISPF